MRAAALLLALPFIAPQDPKGPVKELYDSGKTKATYQLDADGKRDGQYNEFWENGKRKIAAIYSHGVLDRAYEEFTESGKTRLKKRYSQGKIDGDLLRFDDQGVLVHRVTFRKGEVFLYPDLATAAVHAHPRSVEAIRKKLDEIDPPKLLSKWSVAERHAEPPSHASPFKPGKLKKDYAESALRHLNGYRWLSELPANVAMDEGFNDLCQHGAVVIAANGRLSHTPPQPSGMEKAFFDKGYEACSKSNLSMYPGGTLRESIDGFMDDSDPSNIAQVGHRMWILNPPLARVGFGEAGKEGAFKALWVLDGGGRGPVKGAPKDATKPPEFVAYPSRGRYPLEYLHARAAWSVAPAEGSPQFPAKEDLKVEVWELDDEYDLQTKLDLDHVSLTSRKALVFRPVFPKGAGLDGRCFLVSVAWAKGRIAYVVEFFRRASS